MVTIDERLQQLREEESKAKQLADFPIPKRTFRGGIGKAQQDEAVNIRKQGRDYLKNINSERQNLLKQKAEIEAARKEQERLEEEKRALETAQKLAERARQGEQINLVNESPRVKKYFLLSDKARTSQYFALQQGLEKGTPSDEVGERPMGSVSESVFNDLLERAAKGDVISQNTLDKVGFVVKQVQVSSNTDANKEPISTPLRLSTQTQEPLSTVTKVSRLSKISNYIDRFTSLTPIGFAIDKTREGLRNFGSIIREDLAVLLPPKRAEKISTGVGKVGSVVFTPIKIPATLERTEAGLRGFTAQGIESAKNIDLEKEVALFALGGLFGSGVRTGAVFIESKALSTAGIKGFRIARTLTLGTEVGVGTGITLGSIAQAGFNAKNTEQAGRNLELVVQDLAVFGAGAAKFGRTSLFESQQRIVTGVDIQSRTSKKVSESLLKKGILDKTESKTFESSINKAIELEVAFRRSPDVPIKYNIENILPKGLTLKQKAIFKGVLLTEGTQLFGSKSLEIRGITKGSDIDIAAIDNLQKLSILETNLKSVSGKGTVRVRGEAIGLDSEKAIDLKSIERVNAFLFKEPPIKTKEGLLVIKTSEQYARGVSGVLELRKGGKDIKSVVLSGRALIKQIALDSETGLFQGLKKMKARNLEKKMIDVEKLVPLIEKIKPKLTGEELPKLPTRFGFVTDEPPELPSLIPKGKKAQLGGVSSLKTERIKTEAFKPPKISKLEPLNLKKSGFEPSEFKASEIKPTKFKSSIFRPSSFKPSKFKPSSFKPSSFEPSKFTPSKFEPSRFKPSKFTPSRFKPSRFEPPKVPPVTTTPFTPPPAITPPKKRKRGEGFLLSGQPLPKVSVGKRPGKFKEDIFLVEGFTARTLGIRKEIKLKDIEKEARKQSAIGIRPTPVIIR